MFATNALSGKIQNASIKMSTSAEPSLSHNYVALCLLITTIPSVFFLLFPFCRDEASFLPLCCMATFDIFSIAPFCLRFVSTFLLPLPQIALPNELQTILGLSPRRFNASEAFTSAAGPVNQEVVSKWFSLPLIDCHFHMYPGIRLRGRRSAYI